MIKKIIFITIVIAGTTLFCSCKKTKTCDCWKNGEVHKEELSSYELLSSSSNFDVWERYLVEEMGYDSVKCVVD